MDFVKQIYRWLVPIREPGTCDCGRLGLHLSWGRWYCNACEAQRSADVWP